VGKSTLFNRLVGEKRAIVLDVPGVTRDRNYGDTAWRGREFAIVDTGGFEPQAYEGIVASMREQALMAIEEADVVIFVVDGRDGMMTADDEVARLLRNRSEKVLYAVNKIDGASQEGLTSDFYALGADEVFAISAEHGRGVAQLLDAVVDRLPVRRDDEGDDAFGEDDDVTRVALIGRPNVGKSTLANRLLGYERMIVSPEAGTTRDAVDLPLELRDGRRYLLIDTAGLRRKSRIEHFTSEGFSVMRTLKAIERCHVAVMMIDAVEGITEQDARILGVAVDRGRAIVLLVNKWDAIEKDAKTAQKFREQIELKLNFATFAPSLMISAMNGQRVHKLLEQVDIVRAAHRLRIPTGPLNRWLKEATDRHHPPVARGKRLRLYYATQIRVGPPTIMISCNDPEAVHFSYERYLTNQFREAFEAVGTPIRLQFKGKENPFVDDVD
jgi:GTP-binding protein